jgi:hypothetical protein
MNLLKGALAVGLLLCSSLVAAENNTTHDDGWPPLRYMGDHDVAIHFTKDVTQVCGVAPAGYIMEGCEFPVDPKTGKPADTHAPDSIEVLILPNPCSPEYASESYAKLVCHELGHANGWPANHPL